MEQTQTKVTKEKMIRYIFSAICQLFCIGSLVYFSAKGMLSQALICVLSILCLCLPDLAERLFKMKIGLP